MVVLIVNLVEFILPLFRLKFIGTMIGIVGLTVAVLTGISDIALIRGFEHCNALLLFFLGFVCFHFVTRWDLCLLKGKLNQ